MTSGFLCEPQLGEVAHNATSRLFVENPALLGWTEFMSRFYMPVASKFADATEKYQDSDKKNETAANIAMNTELSSFDFITRNKELGRHFGAYMKGVQASEGTNFKHVVSGYDWGGLGEGFVVHVRAFSIPPHQEWKNNHLRKPLLTHLLRPDRWRPRQRLHRTCRTLPSPPAHCTGHARCDCQQPKPQQCATTGHT